MGWCSHPEFFFSRGYRKNASAHLTENRLSFSSIFVTPTLKILGSVQVRSRSYDLIHDVMFGRNRRIGRSIVSGWVPLLSGVLLHCRQHNRCLWISRSHIPLPWGQDHTRSRVPWAVSTVIFLTFQLPWASRALFRAKLMPYLESAPTNWLYRTRHMSRSYKVIRGHKRSLTSDDPEWSNFLLGSTSRCLGVL